jgi:hypothetical protein
MSWQEEIAQHIKDIGQSLIDNAEKIANNYKYNGDLTITCYPIANDSFPRIVIEHEFVPEQIVERYNI